MESEPFIKIIVVGEQGVGKTCLLNQYCYARFDPNSPPTIGCDFTTKVTSMSGKTVRLQLWDIAGQEKYNSVSKLYVRGALGCVIVSDILDQSTLQESLKWKSIVEENCDQIDGKFIPVMLVQNKCDLVGDDRQDFQQQQQLENFAKQNNFLGSVQTSAKENVGLKELFQRIIQEIIDRGLIQTQQQNFQKANNLVLKNENKDATNAQSNQNKGQKDGQVKKGGCC